MKRFIIAVAALVAVASTVGACDRPQRARLFHRVTKTQTVPVTKYVPVQSSAVVQTKSLVWANPVRTAAFNVLSTLPKACPGGVCK
jgi:hypothetical protein